MSLVKNSYVLMLSVVLAAPLAGCANDLLAEDDKLQPYGASKAHPILVQNGKASVPDCGMWPDNLADTSSNELNPNHGCAVQANIAAMAAYPEDLIGGNRHHPKPLGDTQWGAFYGGYTGAGAASGGGGGGSGSGSGGGGSSGGTKP
jgi:type IV pilus biogenesis protein CpaD/CtpE